MVSNWCAGRVEQSCCQCAHVRFADKALQKFVLSNLHKGYQEKLTPIISEDDLAFKVNCKNLGSLLAFEGLSIFPTLERHAEFRNHMAVLTTCTPLLQRTIFPHSSRNCEIWDSLKNSAATKIKIRKRDSVFFTVRTRNAQGTGRVQLPSVGLHRTPILLQHTEEVMQNTLSAVFWGSPWGVGCATFTIGSRSVL